MGAITWLWSSIVEASGELRVHRMRVILSLIGVGISVAALVAVVAGTSILTNLTNARNEVFSGREGVLRGDVYTEDGTAAPMPAGRDPQTILQSLKDEYQLSHAGYLASAGIAWTDATPEQQEGANALLSTMMGAPEGNFGFESVGGEGSPPSSQVSVRGQIESTAVSEMFPKPFVAGGPFTSDQERWNVPAVTITTALWEVMGSPDLARPVTMQLSFDGADPVTARVVGVFEGVDRFDLAISALAPSVYPLGPDGLMQLPENQSTSFLIWIPPGEDTAAWTDAVSAFVAGQLDQPVTGAQFFVNESADFVRESMETFRVVGIGIAVLVLLLGALVLFNVQFVTMKYRVREIGIRRSFGASGGRVFFTVMLESVVGTFVAGLVGVGIAIVVLRSPWLYELINLGEVNVPFPLEAALLGVVVSIGVGALAGLMPAIFATRANVIDAIRF